MEDMKIIKGLDGIEIRGSGKRKREGITKRE
jgi:hypothetical protein